MAHHGVYMYPYNNEVSLGNFNMPFSQEKLTIYRGANNPISFTIHNADGKYTLISDNQYLVFSIFDARNDTRIFETVLDKFLPSWVSEAGQARPTISNKQKVYYGCIVPAGVIQDLSVGSKYRWSITKVTLDGDLIEPTEYLYTGLNYEASAELVISNLAAPTFTPSEEISATKNPSWLPIKDKEQKPISKGWVGDYDVMHTSAIRADAQYGLVDGLSTIAFYFNNFIGRVQLQGCLANETPKDAEDYKWFIIKLDGNEYIENELDDNGIPIPLDGIRSFNFHGQLMWVRVVCCIPPIVTTYPPNVIKKDYNPLNTIPKILIRR
ncbi:virion structural protein [Cronobacter phage vB_CsaM_GAP32]|uniref:Uncharacterized protein n=1 Tax=Cronobacter phage vB_CsaM_GAP32 TaxID=1141136 RepID=K4FB51_9CAUD|nr:virion structural protein [Cronobacter phage vB_CsaM_GAP32]AFC21734.1 hypothetical protein GAP32_284 [Cronobacter phage vB_CsaM_GAP32]